jgi:UDP-2-acetamido-2,6-beta-L-arabino-hexul-4-ose reductase
MKLGIKKIQIHKDARGTFFEVLRREDTPNHRFGQISISTAKPGESKGGHYHKKKREWYFVLEGNARIMFEDRKNKEKKIIYASDKSPKLIEMPRNVIHTVTNTGRKELKILIYITEPYNKRNADTYNA